MRRVGLEQELLSGPELCSRAGASAAGVAGEGREDGEREDRDGLNNSVESGVLLEPALEASRALHSTQTAPTASVPGALA